MASRLGQCQSKLDALEEELLLDDPDPARVLDIRENIAKLEALKAKLSAGAATSGNAANAVGETAQQTVPATAAATSNAAPTTPASPAVGPPACTSPSVYLYALASFRLKPAPSV